MVRNKRVVLSLCMEDLRHEWLLTLCMVMAVAAVLAPLLILFGLKHGTIETLRQRLVMDPRNVEIRPMDVRSYSQQWFENIATHPQVRFVVPTTRQLASTVELRLPDTSKFLSVDAIPTAQGDPLILENGCAVPEDRECLLSAQAAEESGLRTGERITVVVKRIKGSGFESVTVELAVKGILPTRAGATKSIFIPLALLESVENFKDGMGVPALGWPGDIPRAFPVFSHLLLAVPAPLGPEESFLVVNNTGFTKIDTLTDEEARRYLMSPAPEDMAYYMLETKGSNAGIANLQSIMNILRGKKATLYPGNPGLHLTLKRADGTPLGEGEMHPSWYMAGNMSGSMSGSMAGDMSGSMAGNMAERGRGTAGLASVPAEMPWTSPVESNVADSYSVLVPASIPAQEGMATVHFGDNAVTFPVNLVTSPSLSEGHFHVPLPLLGKLGLLMSRPLVWDTTSGEFLLSKRGYAGFRLYAQSLEDVSVVKKFFEDKGLAVHTEAERIDDVLRLDKYLSLIFWLIALASILGGTACLVANIYAGIERKRIDLAVLRLLGLSGSAFLRFPLYTAAFYASIGSLVAFVFFMVLSSTINNVFASHLQQGESLCSLAWWHPFAVYGMTLGIALVAGCVAAKRAMDIEPAEALRNE